VSFLFERVGLIRFPAASADADGMFEAALEAGADNVDSSEEGHEITCAPDSLNKVRDALEAKFGAPESAKLWWRPQTLVPVAEDAAERLFKLLEILEDNDDVQSVIANYEVSDELMQRLAS